MSAVGVGSNACDDEESRLAHLWIWDGEGGTDEWAVAPLEGDGFILLTGPPYVVRRSRTEGEIVLMRTMAGGDAVWALLTAGTKPVRVNGYPVAAGIRVLEDRDEISSASIGRRFFSTERLATVTPFPGGDRPIFCPRCKQPVEPSTPVVRCPACGITHHQSDEYPCWGYADHCGVCSQETSLERGYRWTPDEI